MISLTVFWVVWLKLPMVVTGSGIRPHRDPKNGSAPSIALEFMRMHQHLILALGKGSVDIPYLSVLPDYITLKIRNHPIIIRFLQVDLVVLHLYHVFNKYH